VTLTFWATTRVYVYKFGVDSSSRFPFRARTDRQTDATERPAHAGGYTAGVGNYKPKPNEWMIKGKDQPG